MRLGCIARAHAGTAGPRCRRLRAWCPLPGAAQHAARGLRKMTNMTACVLDQPTGRDTFRADSRCVQGRCPHAAHDRGQLQKGAEEAARPRHALKVVFSPKGGAVCLERMPMHIVCPARCCCRRFAVLKCPPLWPATRGGRGPRLRGHEHRCNVRCAVRDERARGRSISS